MSQQLNRVQISGMQCAHGKETRDSRYSAQLEWSSCLAPSVVSHLHSQGVHLMVLWFLLLKCCCSADTFHSDVVCSWRNSGVLKLLVFINIKPMLSLLICSGSLLGSICHRGAQVAQHYVGIFCQNKQSICSLKLSLANLLLAIVYRGGILNIWPSDPGVKLQSHTHKTIFHFLEVKKKAYCYMKELHEEGILLKQFSKLSY